MSLVTSIGRRWPRRSASSRLIPEMAPSSSANEASPESPAIRSAGDGPTVSIANSAAPLPVRWGQPRSDAAAPKSAPVTLPRAANAQCAVVAGEAQLAFRAAAIGGRVDQVRGQRAVPQQGRDGDVVETDAISVQSVGGQPQIQVEVGGRRGEKALRLQPPSAANGSRRPGDARRQRQMRRCRASPKPRVGLHCARSAARLEASARPPSPSRRRRRHLPASP